MNKKMKKVFFAFLTVIALSATMTGCGPKNNKETLNNNTPEKKIIVETLEDGTKVNKSDKIVGQTKTLGNLEFKNISITESGNLTKISFDVYNNSEELLEEKDIVIILLNEKDEEIKRINNAYIGTILPKETVNWKMNLTLDYTEVYDIKFAE